MKLKNLLTILFLTCCGSLQVYAEESLDDLSKISDEETLPRHQLFEDCLKKMPSAWTGHRLFAEWLVDYLQPNQVVDLGMDYGYSTFIFANAAKLNKKGNVTGIDWFQGDGQTGIRNTYNSVLQIAKKLNFDNLEIIKGDFTEISKTWDKAIDILHIDGYHSYDAVSNDFKTWAPFVLDDGIILFHDVNVPYPGFEVINFFRELQDGYRLYFLQSYGLGIFTKNKELYEEIKKQFINVYDYADFPL